MRLGCNWMRLRAVSRAEFDDVIFWQSPESSAATAVEAVGGSPMFKKPRHVIRDLNYASVRVGATHPSAPPAAAKT